MNDILENRSPEFQKIRSELLREGEEEFKMMEDKFDYFVEIEFDYDEDDIWIGYLNEIERDVEQTFEKNSYWAFPISAIGKHKSKWNRVYFKSDIDSMAFKLKWV